jgi:hypothetical protein
MIAVGLDGRILLRHTATPSPSHAIMGAAAWIVLASVSVNLDSGCVRQP